MKVLAALLLAALPASPLAAQDPGFQQRVEQALRQASPGTRFGLVVATREGQELVAIAPDQRFIPASNTKMFTTAAAFATLPSLAAPDSEGGASVRLERDRDGAFDVVLEGHGDARLSSAAGCVANCLAVLADAIAARTRRIDDVIGDDRWFPDERWSPGMSWNNIHTASGTAISALTLDDNELKLRVVPTRVGQPPRLELLPYYTVENKARTVAGTETELAFERLPGSRILRLTGTVAADAEPETLSLGIDDPAHYAAWRLAALLRARRVRVGGEIEARHRPAGPRQSPAPVQQRPALARLVPPPLLEDIMRINKDSQNVHAELLLRRIGRRSGDGSIADGVKALQSVLERAGVPRTYYDFADGSGMSTYNRVAPRGTVMLLRWIDAQPWAAQWRRTLPVAGLDGTLDERFKGSPLERRLFAKTGTLNATNALSGYLVARSGRTLLFAIYANDVPGGGSAKEAMGAALTMVAEQF